MITGLYSASTAMNALQHKHEVIAQNLAHVGVPGFRGMVSLETPAGSQDTSAVGFGTAVSADATDFTSGPVVYSGRKLDVAIDGKGFFVIQGPNEQLFTRNGIFFVSDKGTLINSEGMPVLGSGGPINIPPGVTEGEIDISRDGTISAGGTSVGQLRIADFADTQQLERAGTTLFRAPSGVVPDDGISFVRQGMHEQSNVAAVDQLVRMLTGMRQYEAAQRVLKTIDESVGSQTNPQQA